MGILINSGREVSVGDTVTITGDFWYAVYDYDYSYKGSSFKIVDNILGTDSYINEEEGTIEIEAVELNPEDFV